MAEQPGSGVVQKGKTMVEQRTCVRVAIENIPMIAGPALISEDEKKNSI